MLNTQTLSILGIGIIYSIINNSFKKKEKIIYSKACEKELEEYIDSVNKNLQITKRNVLLKNYLNCVTSKIN